MTAPAFHLSDPPRCPYQACQTLGGTGRTDGKTLLRPVENDSGKVIAYLCPSCGASFKPNGEVVRAPARPSCIRVRR